MPKPNVVAKWREVGQTYLGEAPEAMVFVNTVEVRQYAGKTLKLIRSVGMETYRGTEDQIGARIRKLIESEDVRLLAKGVDTNDFHTLPREQSPVPPEIMEGTDDVYADKAAMLAGEDTKS